MCDGCDIAPWIEPGRARLVNHRAPKIALAPRILVTAAAT